MLLTVFQAKPVDRPLKLRSTDSAWEEKFYFFSVTGRPTRIPVDRCRPAELSGWIGRPSRSTALHLQSSRLVSVDRTGRPIVVFSPKLLYILIFSLSLSHFSQRPKTQVFPKNFFLSKFSTKSKSIKNPSQFPHSTSRSSISAPSIRQIRSISGFSV